ncbi:MAG: aldo/keto reductase [Desulfurococcales archaeon]|nr:aldo/keto reductase [Desulfurococcales archaeon]
MPKFPIDREDRKPLGKTGERLSAIGLGTWAIRSYEAAYHAFVYAVSLGINHFDTAEMYGAGEAEEFIGRVVKAVGRDNIFITTKLYPYRFRDRHEAVKAARESARRLGVNYIDLVLIHWPDNQASIEEQVRNLEAIAEEGIARYIGVSNFEESELEEAIYSTRKHDIVANQVKYSIVDRRAERLIPIAIKHGVTLQAYSPLERGQVAHIKLLAKIGKRYGRNAVQVALNFLISRPRVVAIPKAESKDHVKELAGAMGWRLSEEDIEFIESKL